MPIHYTHAHSHNYKILVNDAFQNLVVALSNLNLWESSSHMIVNYGVPQGFRIEE